MERYKNTLRGKMIIVLLLILIPFVVLIGFNLHTQKENWKEQQILEAGEEIAVYSQSININFQILEERLVYLPLEDESFQKMAGYSKAEQDTQMYCATLTRIRNKLNSIMQLGGYIENVFAYYPVQNICLNCFYNDEMQTELLAIMDAGIAAGKNEQISGWNEIQTSHGNYLYRIYWTGSFYIGCWISCDSMQSYFLTSDVNREAAVFFCNGAGLDLREQRSEKFAFEDEAKGTLMQANQLYSYIFTAHPGIYLVKELTKEQLQLPGYANALSVLLIVGLTVLLLVSVSAGISKWVLKPVRNLAAGMKKIGNEDVSYRIEQSDAASLEFQEIGVGMNQMLDRLENMRIQMYEQELEQKETKLRYLSQQIQPHFILNSLNTLYTYSKRDSEVTQSIIRLLSKYYRYVVNIESKYVSLEAELDHIENYLQVQKVRLANKLDYEIDCEEGVKIVPIPPFLLESFVGNALKYGQDEDAHIQLSLQAVQIRPFVVQITIRDRGAGFPGEILDALEEYQKTGKKNSLLGVGICNSIERLNLIYENRTKIEFYNEQGAVIEVTIHLLAEQNMGE